MTQLTLDGSIHRFAGWELRPLERQLLVQGQPVKVGSRAFDLLVALVRRRGQVVSKTELLDLVWPGRIVEENNLSVQITALRRLLGEQAITNVAGVGYCFTAASDERQTTDTNNPLPPALRPAAAAPGGAAAGLFGRAAALATLRPLVGQRPLLSIVGTGGVGKTQLARALLAEAGPVWRDGGHWVDLAPLRPGTALMPLVARTLGVLAEGPSHDALALAPSLAGLQALVVLDNCEHLLDEVATVLTALLKAAPGLHWLTTSQEPLRLAGETVFRLDPLDVPRPHIALPEALQCGALALFCERVRAANHRFELETATLPLAAELCRQLDGLPLAIEMAAARVAALGLRGVRDQIDQRLRLRASRRDAPARHHTLLQTFEWSFGLLNPVEQAVFTRLEPFHGGFTARLAQALCAAMPGDSQALQGWQVDEALSALVEKSLVQRQPQPAAAVQRLFLLESARDYARLQLQTRGEIAAVRQAHAEVMAADFDTAQHDLERWRDTEWNDRYVPERRNVSAALAWACSASQPELLARLVAALARLDLFVGAQAEVVQFPVPLDLLFQASVPGRARACIELAWAHFSDGNRETGTLLATRALADFEALGDVSGVYETLTKLMRLYTGRPGLQHQAEALWLRLRQIDDSSIPLRLRLVCEVSATVRQRGPGIVSQLRELAAVAARAGLNAQASACHTNITNELLIEGRWEEAADQAEAMLIDDAKHLRTHAMLCHNHALALVRLGRIDEARIAAQRTLRALPSVAHMVIDVSALAAVHVGQLEDAALMAGWSARFNHERDRHSDAPEAAAIADTRRLLEEGLGAARCDDLMRQGAAMALADLLALAFADGRGSASHGR